MGWTGTKQTRAEAVKECTKSHSGATCIAYTEVPCGVWSVWQLKATRAAEPEREGKRIIALSLIESGRDGYQMVKDMDETVGPCYYDCPPAYLVLATSYSKVAYSPKWRAAVCDYWKSRGVDMAPHSSGDSDTQEMMRANRSTLEAQERAWGSKAYNDSRDYEDGHSDADPGL